MRRRWAGAVLLATVLSAVACNRPEGAAGPRQGGELRVWTEATQVRWDPLEASDVVSAALVAQVYEGLVGYRPGHGGELFPAAAASFTVSDDRLSYAFTLRRQARFHDDVCFPGGRGRPVLARDVRATVERALAHERGPGGQAAIWRIRGARAFKAGQVAHPEGIEVVDERTVRFHLERPTPDFLHLLASPVGWLVPPEAVEYYGAGLADHPVGSGPFRLGRFEPGRTILLVANRGYWQTDEAGRRLPYLEGVRLFASDWAAQHTQEPLHFVPIAAGLGSSRALNLDRLRIHGVPRLNTLYVSWNRRRPSQWTADVRLRRAVAMTLACIDLEDMSWVRSRANGLLPPELPGHRPTPRYPCDLEGARALLRAAGHPDGAGLEPLPLDLVDRWDRLLGDRIRDLLAQIGVRVELRPAARSQHWSRVNAGETTFFRDGWMADYPGAANFLQCYLSDSPSNHTGFRHVRFDSLFQAAEAEPDAGRRATLYRRMDEILLEHLPSVFLVHESFNYYVADEVRATDALVNSFERRFYKFIWLADEGPVRGAVP